MKDWGDKIELVARVAQARRDARDSAPRDSNDHLEAGIFLAMCNAVWLAWVPPNPITVTEDSKPEEEPDNATAPDTDPDPEPTSGDDPFGIGAAGDGGEGDKPE